MSYEGSHEVLVRCGVLAVLFLWLMLESWSILRDDPHKGLKRSVVSVFLFLIFSGIGYATYSNNLQSQRDAVAAGLTITEADPSDSSKPFSARFIIRNSSNITIPKTVVSCIQNDSTYSNGNTASKNLILTSPTTYESPLLAGGDAETFTCPGEIIPQVLRGIGKLTCADISIQVQYAMPFQKKGTTPETKLTRVVTKEEKNGFHWYPQNQTYPWGACSGINMNN